jgi:hypothetical protein
MHAWCLHSIWVLDALACMYVKSEHTYYVIKKLSAKRKRQLFSVFLSIGVPNEAFWLSGCDSVKAKDGETDVKSLRAGKETSTSALTDWKPLKQRLLRRPGVRSVQFFATVIKFSVQNVNYNKMRSSTK